MLAVWDLTLSLLLASSEVGLSGGGHEVADVSAGAVPERRATAFYS